jgi:hypothetical protein
VAQALQPAAPALVPTPGVFYFEEASGTRVSGAGGFACPAAPNGPGVLGYAVLFGVAPLVA